MFKLDLACQSMRVAVDIVKGQKIGYMAAIDCGIEYQKKSQNALTESFREKIRFKQPYQNRRYQGRDQDIAEIKPFALGNVFLPGGIQLVMQELEILAVFFFFLYSSGQRQEVIR